MKVKYGSVDISRGSDSPRSIESPSNFRINAKRVIQISQAIRADAIKTFDRKNAQTTITFTVTREHVTVQDAELFALTHELSLPNQDLLILMSEEGKSTQNVFLARAVLTDVGVDYNGVLSMSNYTFIGGKLTKTKPAP